MVSSWLTVKVLFWLVPNSLKFTLICVGKRLVVVWPLNVSLYSTVIEKVI